MIVAVDPGQNTGMAFRFDNGAWGTLTVEKVPSADERFDMVLTTLREHFEKSKCGTLVLERFTSMSRYLSKYGIETIELVGAIRALCYLHGVQVVLQMPSNRLAMESEAEKLLAGRKLRFTDHEVSALSHLLVYEYMNRKVETNA